MLSGALSRAQSSRMDVPRHFEECRGVLRGLRGQLVDSWIGRFGDVARSNDPPAKASRPPRPLPALGATTFRIPSSRTTIATAMD